tara:strand:- start:389 stop:1141 length:753 start_codon:yes stop_codon:yes gene_type:complete
MKPFFTIITITKDNPEDFTYTADSLTVQTFRNFEWIVVDSSKKHISKTNTQKFKSKINKLILSEANGISNAWNRGIKEAIGEFIFILNSGDAYEKNFLAIYSQNISSSNYIYCSTAKLQNPLKTKTVGKLIAKPSQLWRGMHIAHCSICMPREMHKKYGYYPEIDNAMDFSLFSKIYKSNGKHIFKVINTTSYALYTLGGHSEINYFEGLSQSRKINMEQGMNPFLAFLIELLYKIKFIIINSLRKFFIK